MLLVPTRCEATADDLLASFHSEWKRRKGKVGALDVLLRQRGASLRSVASEIPPPRVVFPALPEARVVMHNEEHLVLETPRAGEFPVGSVLMGIPWHICPTMALHSHVQVAHGGVVEECWPVVARNRQITF